MIYAAWWQRLTTITAGISLHGAPAVAVPPRERTRYQDLPELQALQALVGAGLRADIPDVVNRAVRTIQ